jgi:hypothetical protein
MDRVRKLGWVYFAGFIAVGAIGYVPGFHDADGNLFGLLTPSIAGCSPTLHKTLPVKNILQIRQHRCVRWPPNPR